MKKKKIKFFDPFNEKNDYQFWKSKSEEERLEALEKLRDFYLTNEDGTRQRLQRVLTVTRKK